MLTSWDTREPFVMLLRAVVTVRPFCLMEMLLGSFVRAATTHHLQSNLNHKAAAHRMALQALKSSTHLAGLAVSSAENLQIRYFLAQPSGRVGQDQNEFQGLHRARLLSQLQPVLFRRLVAAPRSSAGTAAFEHFKDGTS